MKSAVSFLLGALLLSQSAFAAIEYGIFERSSDGRFQSLCPVRDNGAVVCTYTYGLKQVSVTIDQLNAAAHLQNLRALEALGPIVFYDYDEAVRKLVPATNFLLNGYYVKFDSRTILLDFAHFYSPVQFPVAPKVRTTIASILHLLSNVYYSHITAPNPFVPRLNHCPVLVGRYLCARNALVVTQKTYGSDELYVLQYSDRPAPFDFGANDAGMKNAADRYVATCADGAVNLDGSVMRLNAARDLEFASGTAPALCRRDGLLGWH